MKPFLRFALIVAGRARHDVHAAPGRMAIASWLLVILR